MIDLLIMAGGPEEANELGKQILGYPGLWITHNSEVREILNATTLKPKEI